MIGFLKSLSGHILGFIFVFILIFMVSSMFNAVISPILGGLAAMALTQLFFCAMSHIHFGEKWKIFFAFLNISVASMLGFYAFISESYPTLPIDKIIPFLITYALFNFIAFKIWEFLGWV